MGKYISYSLWGDNKVYTYGIIENVLLAKKLYPDWVVRIHYNKTVPDDIIKWLGTQDNTELIIHTDNKLKASNMFWRFEDFFMKDATVIIRDADSRISEREVLCVNEWLQSSKDFHIIRDHEHHTVPIVGGAIGCRNNCLEYIGVPNGNRNINGCPFHFENGLEFMKRFIHSLHTEMDKYNIDQIFLYHYVYPYVINNSFVHCSHNAYEPFAVHINPVTTGFIGEIVMECSEASKIMGDTDTIFERVQQI